MIFAGQGIGVVDRPTFDGEQQRKALTDLQKAAGLKATEAAHQVGLSYPQYNRYLWGRVPLRTDQLSAFAAAFRISKADLSRALGLMDDDIDPVLRARTAEAYGADNTEQAPHVVDALARTLAQHSDSIQDDVLAQLRDALSRLPAAKPSQEDDASA